MVRLVPREEKYFEMLGEMAAKVREGGDVFARMFQDFENVLSYAEQIKGLEVACDELMARIINKLNTSFITPIDREDIYLLTTELDDVIDMMNDFARRLEIYGVAAPKSEAQEMAGLLSRATHELESAFSLLDKNKGVVEHCRIVSQVEKRADSLYSDALRRLFKEEKDPMEVIKWMSLYEELENSIDRCKDVAEALEAVVVKNK